MGVREILFEFLNDVDPAVRQILAEVLLAEQRRIDMQRPRVKEDIREAIDAQVRLEEKSR
jgi:hypothetical protein